MTKATLTEEQWEQLWRALPREFKRRLTAQFELELAQERRLRQQAFYERLRNFAREKGVDWEQLSVEERLEFVRTYRQPLALLDDLFQQHEAPVESALRAAALQRGLNWDAMNDEERLTFVAEWLEE